MGGRKGGREGGMEGGCEGGREGGREGERIILQKCILWCVLLMSEKEDTHPTHIHLTLSNTVHEADAARGNDHFARHLPEVCGGHPCQRTPAGNKTIPWRDINSD